MTLIRRSWALMISIAGRLPAWLAVLVAFIAVPLWLVTVGLLGILYELISRLDTQRVRGEAQRSPAPDPVRWAGAGVVWVLTVSMLGGSGAEAGSGPATPSSASSGGTAAVAAPTATLALTLAPSPRASRLASPTPTPSPISPAAPSEMPTPSAPPPVTPSPSPTPTLLVFDDTVVAAEDRAVVTGAVGTYTWTDVSFPEEQAIVRWSVTAKDVPCQIRWTVSGDDGSTEGRRVSVEAGSNVKGRVRFDTDYARGTTVVKSTCPVWRLSLQGDTPPPPTPRPTQRQSGGSCHPSYKGACLRPDASDYDCAGGSGNGPYYVDGPIYVVGYDEYDLDRDNDGLGCE